ncbi:MAG: hypothetical protein KA354_02880 [Phycisphaerae bacterium]|nr:hypothetical protein [Phycisphaerae bacterium]
MCDRAKHDWGVEPLETGCWQTGKATDRMIRAFTGSFFAKDKTARREYFPAFAEDTVITL